jgi:uncharacterized protein
VTLQSVAPARITATPAAREAIGRLRATRGGPVMFVQSGGCCAGSTPMCFPAGEFVIGDIDVLLGEVDGCPFYIDKRLDQAWHQDQFLLDVAVGEPEDFSLAAGENRHFVTRSPACEAPDLAKEADRPGQDSARRPGPQPALRNAQPTPPTPARAAAGTAPRPQTTTPLRTSTAHPLLTATEWSTP